MVVGADLVAGPMMLRVVMLGVYPWSWGSGRAEGTGAGVARVEVPAGNTGDCPPLGSMCAVDWENVAVSGCSCFKGG